MYRPETFEVDNEVRKAHVELRWSFMEPGTLIDNNHKDRKDKPNSGIILVSLCLLN